MKKKIYLIVLVSAGFILSCKSKKEAANPATDRVCISDSMAGSIRIDTVREQAINDEVKLSGEVAFNDNKVVKIFPFSSGQVLKVMVSLGDKVSKGQTLAIIKSADVAGNYSDLSVSGNDIVITKKQMDNAESLFKNGIASEKEFIEARENYNKAVAAAEKIKEQIHINGGGRTSASGTYIVTAPISGYIVEKNAQPGSFIRGDNTQNLFTVGDITNVWIWANVYETDVAKVKEGYTAEVNTLAYPGKTFIGRVDKANQILDPDTKVMRVRIALKNDSLELKPEMFANVRIKNEEKIQMTTIPSEGIITDNGKNFVIVYYDKCHVEIRQVEIFKTVNGITYISSGLQTGEKIISKNQVLLYRALLEN
jgi:cobalt-zinc-cadmium efflux system membrane fusion protein